MRPLRTTPTKIAPVTAPSHVGAALVEHGEPDQRRGDAVEQQRRAGEHVAASHPRRDEDAAQRRKNAGDDISGDPVGLDRRPGQIGGRLVAADRVEDAAPAGALHEEPEDDSDDRDDDDWQRRDAEQLMAADRQEHRIEGALRDRAVGEDEAGRDRASGARDELKPGEQEHHAERREQVRDAQATMSSPLTRPITAAGHQGERDRRRRAELPARPSRSSTA